MSADGSLTGSVNYSDDFRISAANRFLAQDQCRTPLGMLGIQRRGAAPIGPWIEASNAACAGDRNLAPIGLSTLFSRTHGITKSVACAFVIILPFIVTRRFVVILSG